MSRSQLIRNRWFQAASALCLFVVACTLNPATGERQLTLMSEAQEIAIGGQAHPDIIATYGVYPDQAWQDYIQELGAELAKTSERPNLNWTFTILDDPVVNAMALPGGFIYVNRGILAHFNSEAELASVLGHEIGHVTGRHSVEQMSRAQLANLGLGAAATLSEDFRQYAGLASSGIGILFLKFGRDDERQADNLGFRYMTRAGYDPTEMPKVFHTLDRMSDAQGGQQMPTWLSTHPDPGNRAERMNQTIAGLSPEERQGIVGRQAYLERLDGMVFGTNPREGYSIGNAFYHPDLEFKLVFPQGWQIINQRQAVGALSPEKDSVIVLTISDKTTPSEAVDAFFAQEGIERGRMWRQEFHSFRTVDVSTGAKRSQGMVGFVSYRGAVYQILGYASAEKWETYEDQAKRSLASFTALKERKYIDVEPKKINTVKLSRTMTLSEFARKYPSTVDASTIAILNGIEKSATLEAGTQLKRVVGGVVPGQN